MRRSAAARMCAPSARAPRPRGELTTRSTLPRRDQVDRVLPGALAHLRDDGRDRDAVRLEVRRGASGRNDARNRARRSGVRAASARGLVSVGERQEDRPAASAAGRPRAIWLLANARPNVRSMPMTSPVERISGPSTRVDLGEAVERAAPLPSPRRARRGRRARAGPRRAAPRAWRRPSPGRRPSPAAPRLPCHERDRAAGPRVRLDDEDLARPSPRTAR